LVSPRWKTSRLLFTIGPAEALPWCHWTQSATVDPDASAWLRDGPNFVGQVTWNAALSNKLLIDAGYTVHPESWGWWPEPNLPWGTYAVTDLATGINFNAAGTGDIGGAYAQHRSMQMNGKFYVSYVTGSHAFKVGFQDLHGSRQIRGCRGAAAIRSAASRTSIRTNSARWITS
jgi:hypothetical protein